MMIVHDVRDERRAIAVRRAVERGALADRALERGLRAFELRVARIEPAPLVVVVRVVPEELSVLVQRAGDLRLGVDRLADLEERSLHVRGVEDAHDRQRRREVGPVVEGERDLAVGGAGRA